MLETELIALSERPDASVDELKHAMLRFVVRKMAETPDQVSVRAVADTLQAVAANKKVDGGDTNGVSDLLDFFGGG